MKIGDKFKWRGHYFDVSMDNIYEITEIDSDTIYFIDDSGEEKTQQRKCPHC